ncbi:hypothetical protein CRYUN_Cryun16bG0081700 [Craigia yunnanensis]
MKRDSKKDSTNGGICDVPDVATVRSSMIGEIENRSAHLIAIKADVETQGEFVNSLIREVNSVVYQNIEDVVAFVKWLDDELCYLPEKWSKFSSQGCSDVWKAVVTVHGGSKYRSYDSKAFTQAVGSAYNDVPYSMSTYI